MTERERKDYYLKRIRKVLGSKFFKIPMYGRRHLEEELKIIMWNNYKDWANAFIEEEVVPLLKAHGITIDNQDQYQEALDYASK